MRIISFSSFKFNCKHLGETWYEFGNKQECTHAFNDNVETLCYVRKENKRWRYHPCKEKYCPVMAHLKKI